MIEIVCRILQSAEYFIPTTIYPYSHVTLLQDICSSQSLILDVSGRGAVGGFFPSPSSFCGVSRPSSFMQLCVYLGAGTRI
jgi:hypothetical protein